MIARTGEPWKTVDLRTKQFKDGAAVREVDLHKFELFGPMLPAKRVTYLNTDILPFIADAHKARFLEEVALLCERAAPKDSDSVTGDGMETGEEEVEAEASMEDEDMDAVVRVRMPQAVGGSYVVMVAPEPSVQGPREPYCSREECEHPEENTADSPLVCCDWCAEVYHIDCFPPGSTDPATTESDVYVACGDCFQNDRIRDPQGHQAHPVAAARAADRSYVAKKS